MNSEKAEDIASRTDAADGELVCAVMELHQAEVADYAICECIDCGQAEALKEEVEQRERARLDAAKKRLRELMEARGPRATKTISEKGVPVGLVGVHALVNIVPGDFTRLFQLFRVGVKVVLEEVKQTELTLTIIAGFRQWQAAGRQVSPGQKAAGYIYVPLKRKKDGQDITPEKLRFRLVPVFDIAQTEESVAAAA